MDATGFVRAQRLGVALLRIEAEAQNPRNSFEILMRPIWQGAGV
jgi:hypothetical protein